MDPNSKTEQQEVQVEPSEPQVEGFEPDNGE